MRPGGGGGDDAMEPSNDGGPLTVVDVYDIAADIGKEFERVIDEFGPDAFARVMPKVVTALEYLEAYTGRLERDDGQLAELRALVSRLETEMLGKAEDRDRFEKELERIEEDWRVETKELLDLVTRLKEENRRLASALDEKNGEPQSPNAPHEQDANVLQRMKELIDWQRDQLRAKEKELVQGANESDAFQSQLERVTQVNKELRRKHKCTQQQTRLLIEEKAELQAQLQEQQRVMVTLKQSLGIAQKDNEDLIKAKTEPSPGGRPAIDENDPHAPRFTISELKNILFERNELKARVSELEDELNVYKPKPAVEAADEDDPPVQGPINQEPPDAPWKKQDSGIRKLFRVLFGGSPKEIRHTLLQPRNSYVPEPMPVAPGGTFHQL